MIIPEEIKKQILLEHQIEVNEKEASHRGSVSDAIEQLNQEICEKFDCGIPKIDVTIELKNRLWLMEKNNVDRDSPEYIALKKLIDTHHRLDAENFYETQGWKRKFSGEWVRK